MVTGTTRFTEKSVLLDWLHDEWINEKQTPLLNSLLSSQRIMLAS